MLMGFRGVVSCRSSPFKSHGSVPLVQWHPSGILVADGQAVNLSHQAVVKRRNSPIFDGKSVSHTTFAEYWCMCISIYLSIHPSIHLSIYIYMRMIYIIYIYAYVHM